MTGSSTTDRKRELDPMRVILGLLANGSSDTLVRIASLAGIAVDLTMTEAEAYSHGTRIRTLLPRVQRAYDALGEPAKLAAASVAAAELSRLDAEMERRLIESLARVGWKIDDGHLIPGTPDLRDMFFPKGSLWDAFVVLRRTLAEASTEITIVDSYCDGTVFELLAGRDVTRLTIRILCSSYAPALAAEARKFVAQFPGVKVEVRRTADFHDRFVVLDRTTCVHVGASLKDAGRAACMISNVDDPTNKAALLAAIEESWRKGVPEH